MNYNDMKELKCHLHTLYPACLLYKGYVDTYTDTDALRDTSKKFLNDAFGKGEDDKQC